MAKGFTSSTIRVHLELSEAEATWLRALLQNPLNLGDLEDIRTPEDEDPQDRTHREAIFNAIPFIRS